MGQAVSVSILPLSCESSHIHISKRGYIPIKLSLQTQGTSWIGSQAVICRTPVLGERTELLYFWFLFLYYIKAT